MSETQGRTGNTSNEKGSACSQCDVYGLPVSPGRYLQAGRQVWAEAMALHPMP